jgi:hypothetical protein
LRRFASPLAPEPEGMGRGAADWRNKAIAPYKGMHFCRVAWGLIKRLARAPLVFLVDNKLTSVGCILERDAAVVSGIRCRLDLSRMAHCEA